MCRRLRVPLIHCFEGDSLRTHGHSIVEQCIIIIVNHCELNREAPNSSTDKEMCYGALLSTHKEISHKGKIDTELGLYDFN